MKKKIIDDYTFQAWKWFIRGTEVVICNKCTLINVKCDLVKNK